MKLVEMTPGRATMELRASRKISNTRGFLHGGAIATLADTAMGAACWSVMPAGQPFVTLDLRISYLKAVRSGRLRAEGALVRHGSTAQFAECSITDEEGVPVARASCTFLALDRPGA